MADSKSSGNVFVCNKLQHAHVLKGGEVEITIAGATDGSGDALVFTNEYAVTPVPAEHWAKWKEIHKDSPLLKNNLLFAEESQSGAKSKANDQREVKTGKEPLTQKDFGAGVKPGRPEE